MPDDLVLDASAAAKIFFRDGDSGAVQIAMGRAGAIFAPDLIFAEMTSVAAKMAARGQTTHDEAMLALTNLPRLIDETTPMAELVQRAYAFASRFSFSAYDGFYLALAERRGAKVLTADQSMQRRAEQRGLGHLVQGPG